MQASILSNRYRVLKKLGEGGFGQTFLAEDLHLPTKPKVVVKHLKPQADNEETVSLANRLFQQEAEILYRLGSHPFIPQLLAHFSESGEFFLVQECIEGLTIAQEYAGGARYAEKEVIQLLGQTLETLSFVHQQKVIHRDIKPANLIRRRSDGNIFLIDFGAVKQVGAFPQNSGSSTFSTLTIGSHGYMPMEQLAGKPNYSSDLYALGLVAIEGLTGIKPTDLKQNQNTGEYIWTHKITLSPEIEHFVCKLVRFDYRQRFHSANEAFASLNMQANKVGFFANKMPVPIQPAMPALNNINASFPVKPPPVQSQPTNIKPTNNLPAEHNQDAEIPPTLIVPVKQNNGFVSSQITLEPINSIRREAVHNNNALRNDFSEKFAAYKYGIGFFVILLFLGGLVYSVNSLVKTYQPQPVSEKVSNKENTESEGKEAVSNLPGNSSYSLFDEAEKQANEARQMETKATTKYEWEEIGNKYKRAYALLASIAATSPEYAKAREKINYYKQKAETAFQKISTALETPKINTASAPSTVTSQIETVSQSSNPNTETAPLKITMPPKQSYKTYLSYNLTNGNNVEKKVITTDDAMFTGSVEKHSENKRDSGVVRIRIEGGSYSSAALELKPVYGQKLTAGNYPGAQEYLWQSPTRYAVAFDKLRCFEKGNHSFTINSIVYDELYSNVSLLDATFTINCDNRRLMGRIRYDFNSGK